MDIFILYLIIIDSYGVTQSKPISTDPKTNQFCMFGLLRLPLYKNWTLCKRLSKLAVHD